MAELPQCPNFRDGKCERSEIILLGEADTHYSMYCKCCKLCWIISKTRTKGRAREELHMKNIREANRRERMQAKQVVKFYAPAKGWR